MKVLIVGLGSMGKRRIRLICQNFEDIKLVGVDSREDRRVETLQAYGINSYADLEEAINKEKPEIAFICTSPVAHPELTLRCLQVGMHIFSEINLINTNHEKLIELSDRNGVILFLSSTPMYRKEIQYIEQMIHGFQAHKCFYRYHVGQYLPDWHPWESHQDFFVADKRTNGCRELFAIELPWILKTFGSVKRVMVEADTISSLNLGFPDTYLLILEHISGHKGLLAIDIVSRKAVRSLEIISEALSLKWDGTVNGLEVLDIQNKRFENIRLYGDGGVSQDSRYAENIIENAYLEEIMTFFESIKGNIRNNRTSFEKDKEILDLIDTIEKSTGGIHDLL